MIQINKSVAQEIVDKAIQIIKLNVNIMDCNGIIIASGDKSRIGQLHEGALISISREETVIIDSILKEKLSGTNEGINMPIFFREDIIGVVGISGKSELVKNYSELVKMTTELSIEQSFLINEQINHKKSKEHFLHSLLNNSKNIFNVQLSNIYKEKLNLDFFHKICILDLKEKDFLPLNNKLDKIQKFLSNNSNVNFTIIDDDFKVIFCISDKYESKVIRKCKKLVEKLLLLYCDENENCEKKLRLYIGLPFKSKNGIHKSYLSARNVYKLNFTNTNQCIWAFDYIKEVITIQNNELEKNVLIEIWTILIENDKNKELVKTLNCFYNNNCEISLTSDKLHIHRNTLNYRLDKIFEITKLNPKNKSHLFTLTMAESLYINM